MFVDTYERVPRWGEYAYNCAYCGMQCFHYTTPSGISSTKTGNYGSDAVPTPKELTVELVESTTISFHAASGSTPAYLADSMNQFGDNGFRAGMAIRVETTSGTNDGNYTVDTRGVSRSQLLLSTDDSLTDEAAATAGIVTISHVRTEPNITTGCPFCGSLNSKGE